MFLSFLNLVHSNAVRMDRSLEGMWKHSVQRPDGSVGGLGYQRAAGRSHDEGALFLVDCYLISCKGLRMSLWFEEAKPGALGKRVLGRQLHEHILNGREHDKSWSNRIDQFDRRTCSMVEPQVCSLFLTTDSITMNRLIRQEQRKKIL